MARGLKFRIYIKYRDCTTCIYAAKRKSPISFAVTAKLICVFVFAYPKSRSSHGAAHMDFVMVLQYIQHYLHTRIKQVAGFAQCASIDFLNVLHFVSARSRRMVLGNCIVHNVLLFLRSREWRVLVRIFSRRRRFRAGFFSLLGVLEVGSLLRVVTNDI